ncbi:MAG: ParB/RepB/Spo0J family partition protein [Dehalococcoidia bacterium]|nr:ParB/RepB/Spo0J family partition protein [Dehalococcoidia bacterium]
MAETNKGRASEQRPATEALRDLWAGAADLNEQQGNVGGRGVYVPWETVVVREDLTPRTALHHAAIAQYAEVLDEVPPIHVQRDTFVLLDGRHRLEAAATVRDHIRIVEVEIPDDELFAYAIVTNNHHGVPLTLAEKQAGARRLLAEHPEWADKKIAELAGLSARTVWSYREDAKRREQEAAAREQRDPDIESVAPTEREGVDGVKRPVPLHQPHIPQPAPKPGGAPARASRSQLSFAWLEALDSAFDDAPDPDFMEPEWAEKVSAELRIVETKLMHAANEAGRLALRYADSAKQARADNAADEASLAAEDARQAARAMGPVAVADRNEHEGRWDDPDGGR